MSSFVPDGWSEAEIDRETLLDITVNLIPMGILAFFIVLFLVYSPFPPDPLAFVISHGLTIVPFVFLGLLTYISAKVIGRDEGKTHQRSEMAMGIDTEAEHGELEAGESPAVEQAERQAVEQSDGPDTASTEPTESTERTNENRDDRTEQR